jgi:polysaccharide biosynthesis protein PslH
VRELAPGVPTTVVPNGVDLDRVRPPGSQPTPPERSGAVFVGKMDYRPNVDAVEWFVGEVLPRIRIELPEFDLTVVGAPVAPAVRALGRSPWVRVTGPVADPLPFLHRAAVAVVPVRARSGSRLKVLEALAAGTPVVSTPAGAEGLDVTDGEHLLLARDAAAFATAVVGLCRDGGRRDRLAGAGRQRVEARYGWGPAVEALRAVHERVVAEPSRA